MKKYRRALLHGLLVAAFICMPIFMFGYNGDRGAGRDMMSGRANVERTQQRFRFGVYYGRPYWYRPHYYYYPYRPYYYRYYYYPYRPYHHYRW